ncbi:sigma-70 family RNA polymerase sigma factor [Mycolicibacterium gilvum]|uniref:ECF subfamily RNA polymerase sigma-24 factor n=1 Tax=Mycolicibacterium gilvum TaxID=1804 RepID=A0A378SWE2_9MYCO|nr:sigma-70 family RNA polymerase sigma factor [Mycolicibacterium gilvum]MCV7053955.1 sigma-70 family RNA polymerase sigma factor [Mycolicibacterium gilvum]STZ46216.1 ECF subfamily RNA polymerase sigma-24 factor [Mycolicibacterium gilvum]
MPTLLFERDVIPLIRALYPHAYRLTREHADAEDLLQETSVKAYRAFGSAVLVGEGTNLAGWLYRIMRNTHLSAYRRRLCRPALQFTGEVTGGVARSTEDVVLTAAGDPAVAAAMRALPEKYRTAVYYADVEGRTFREIAELVDVPIGTVMSRLHRGRTRLRVALADVARDRGYPLFEAA